MAYLNICGFEAANANELVSTTGTLSYNSTTKRTGGYSFRCNPTAATGYGVIQKKAANGTNTAFAVSSGSIYATFYAYFTSLPSADIMIAAFYDSAFTGDGEGAAVQLNSSGNVRAVSAGNLSSSAATITTGVWYRFDLRYTASSGTASVAVDGGTVQSAIGFFGTINNLAIGILETTTADAYFDDIAISDSAYPGAGGVYVIKPNGAGDNAQWTNGSGTTFAEVDDAGAHDSDTTYLMETGTNGTHSLAMGACPSPIGTIGAVKIHTVIRNVSVAAGSIANRSVSGATAVTETAWTTGSTTYTPLEHVKNTDNNAAAWTSSTIDSMQVGVVNANTNDARCTTIMAMIWAAPASAVKAFRRALLGVGV